ncbi:MAG: winged helix-turn-helix transcriptional regulator, partial [Clostridium sp.]|nr:winged helix-turn-helix transcriptional regulator [Clostridium sp.]
NPIIAKFFANIGYADSLGSGVRNLYKYTKIYSNAEPDIEEGDIFRILIPIDNSKVGGKISTDIEHNGANEPESEFKIDSEWAIEKLTDVTERKILELIKTNPEYKTTELAEIIGINRKTVSLRIKKLKERGIIERMGSDRKGYWKILI